MTIRQYVYNQFDYFENMQVGWSSLWSIDAPTVNQHLYDSGERNWEDKGSTMMHAM